MPRENTVDFSQLMGRVMHECAAYPLCHQIHDAHQSHRHLRTGTCLETAGEAKARRQRRELVTQPSVILFIHKQCGSPSGECHVGRFVPMTEESEKEGCLRSQVDVHRRDIADGASSLDP